MITLIQEPPSAARAAQAPAPAAPPAIGSLEALQQRQTNLQEVIGVYQAQRPVLERQMRGPDPVLRSAAGGQLMQLDLNLASAQAELASVQGQIATHQGARSGHGMIMVNPQSPQSFLDRVDPDAITAAFVITVICVLLPLSIGLARRLWRRPPQPVGPSVVDALAPRLDRLEHAVDAIAIEIERIAEGQRFVTKVMAERPAHLPPPMTPAANDASALGEPKPFLALGAGPIEPIRVAERQAVRQSVTPH